MMKIKDFEGAARTTIMELGLDIFDPGTNSLVVLKLYTAYLRGRQDQIEEDNMKMKNGFETTYKGQTQ